MELTIHSKNQALKLTVSPSDNSTRQKTLMSDHVLNLTFTAFECVRIEVLDYVDFAGVRFWAMEEYAPKEVSTVEWEYNCKFYGIENLIGQALVLELTDGKNDPVFSLTAPAREHMALIVANINRKLGVTDWKVGEVISTENITIDYQGTYCDEALSKLADETESEFWFDGQTVNLRRCEYGEEITLGYDNGLTSLDRQAADNIQFFTRLFPIGSSRNIDPDEYGYSRLQLPSKMSYVEQNIEQGVVEYYEEEAFSGIYPRRVGTISSVRSEEKTGEDGDPFTIYYFKDSEIPFDPNDYELPGLVKQVTFQSGELNGRDFEVNYDSRKQEFEIITQWPYDDDTQLPGGVLIPKEGDSYILWNIKMPAEYYPLAEKEYAEAVDAYMQKHNKDRFVYKGGTDYVDLERRALNIDIGRRVRLESSKYFPATGYRSSRITSITQNVLRPTEMDLEISDVLGKGYRNKVDDELSEIRHYAQTASSALPDIVRSWESTPASDFNLFSSKRSMKEFLNKRSNDTAQGLITFEQGLRIGGFKSGSTGGSIDAQGNAELLSVVVRNLLRSVSFEDGMTGSGWQLWLNELGISNLTIDRLTVRQTMSVLEMLVEKVRAVGGQMIVSAASGKIASVDMDQSGENYRLAFEMGCPFVAGDLIRCSVMNGSTPKAYWVEVAAVDGGIATVAMSEFEGALPAVGDEVVLMGHVDNPLRQGVISISATEDGQPRIDVLNGVSGKTLAGCLHARLGNLDGISDNWFPADGQPHGYGLYADNAFLKGHFLLATGEDVATKFEVMENTIRTSIESVRNDSCVSSLLRDPNFSEGLSHWEVSDSDAEVVEEDGRRVMHFRVGSLTQRNEDFENHPEFTAGPDGLFRARLVFLQFFYKCFESGEIDVAFEGVDQTGFQYFEEFHISQEIDAGDGYRLFEGSGWWNGTGDFRLSFSGTISLYAIVLSMDSAEALVYSNKTLFEQTDQLVKIATESFDKDGNLINTTGLISKKDVAGLFAIGDDGALKSFVGASTEGVFIKAGSIKLEGLVTANDNFKILDDGSVEAKNGVFRGKIEATSGAIGGFEIGENRIGSAATQSGDGGGLAIYEDFFRVGGRNGYVFFGDNVVAASTGGAFSAAGRIVNNKPNTGAEWGFASANYGLIISVSGGTQNYGIESDAPMKAPTFIGTRLCNLHIDGSSYQIDFAQSNRFRLFATQRFSINLPNEQSVARMFSLSELPVEFSTVFMIRVAPGSQRVVLNGIYNQNEDLSNIEMAPGDSIILEVSKIDGFRYNLINLTT